MIPPHLLHETGQMVASRLGWDYGHSRASDLERGLVAMARDLGIGGSAGSVTGWLEGLEWNDETLGILAKYLTVGETYFFREKQHLDLLRNVIIPELMEERCNSGRSLSIWSAGCCSGEEPFTLAMLIRETFPELTGWKIRIMATDINPLFLQKAEKGAYSAWSFRETDPGYLEKYFRKSGAHWLLLPEIRNMVSFSLLNLADREPYRPAEKFSGIDVIFCRNVLMYFTPGQIVHVSGRFYESLAPGGWLITSAVERNDDLFPAFTAVRTEQGIVYRKLNGRSPEPGVSKERSFRAERIETKVSPAVKNSPSSRAIPRRTMTGSIPLKKVKAAPASPAELFEARDYHRCMERCESILGERPDDMEAILLMVRSLANLGRLVEAAAWGDRLISCRNPVAGHFYHVAAVRAETGETEMSELLLRKSLYLDPHQPSAHFLMAMVSMKLGKPEAGKRHYRQVMEILAERPDQEIFPELDGLTAGRLREMASVSFKNIR